MLFECKQGGEGVRSEVSNGGRRLDEDEGANSTLTSYAYINSKNATIKLFNGVLI